MNRTDHERLSRELAEELSELALQRGIRIAVAESLTCGLIATTLGAAPDASEWFVGGVVAYSNHVKTVTLGVPPGPVITAQCAREMKDGIITLVGADYAVAVTGVGGPGEEEGEPAGRVYVCSGDSESSLQFKHDFRGDPESVLAATVFHALRALLEALQREAPPE